MVLPTETATPTPTEPAPEALQSARYTYDGDGAMVRGEVNGVVTFYAGRHYHQEVDGIETTVRKFYLLGNMTIAVRTVQGATDTLN